LNESRRLRGCLRQSRREREYIERTIRRLEQSIAFFGSHNKAERERWIVDDFLTNLGAFPRPEEVISSTEPPDVLYRDARFEVQEVMDDGQLRHAELKSELARARNATSISDLGGGFGPRDMTYAEALARIHAAAKEKSDHYGPRTCTSLALLLYVNMQNVFEFIPTPLPDSAVWMPYCFRTVSVTMGRLAGVLYFNKTALAFLRTGGIRVQSRPT
jgi:hypothetical protein